MDLFSTVPWGSIPSYHRAGLCNNFPAGCVCELHASSGLPKRAGLLLIFCPECHSSGAHGMIKAGAHLLAYALSHSHGRHEVPTPDNAAKEVVAVPLHSAQRHVPCRFHERDIQPDGYMVQLRALQLMDRACIPGTHRVGGDVPAVRDPVRDGVDGEVAAGLCENVKAAGRRGEAQNGTFHAVDEVGALVNIARNVHSHAPVHFHAPAACP